MNSYALGEHWKVSICCSPGSAGDLSRITSLHTFSWTSVFFLLFWSRHLALVRSLTLVFHIGEVSLIWNVGVLLVISQQLPKGWSTRAPLTLPWNLRFKLTPHAFEFPAQPFHRVPLSIAMLLWTRMKVFLLENNNVTYRNFQTLKSSCIDCFE